MKRAILLEEAVDVALDDPRDFISTTLREGIKGYVKSDDAEIEEEWKTRMEGNTPKEIEEFIKSYSHLMEIPGPETQARTTRPNVMVELRYTKMVEIEVSEALPENERRNEAISLADAASVAVEPEWEESIYHWQDSSGTWIEWFDLP